MYKPPLPPRSASSSAAPSPSLTSTVTSSSQPQLIPQPQSPGPLLVPPPIPLASKPRISTSSTARRDTAIPAGASFELNSVAAALPHAAPASGSKDERTPPPLPPRVKLTPNVHNAKQVQALADLEAADARQVAELSVPSQKRDAGFGHEHDIQPASAPSGASDPPWTHHAPTVEDDTSTTECDHDPPRAFPAAHQQGRVAAVADCPSHLTHATCGIFYTASTLPCNGQFDHADEYFVVGECPNDQDLPYNAFWFLHDQTPGFSICSKCYEFYIRHSVFESSFSCKVIPGNTSAARCLFGVTRMTETLWPRAVQTSEIKDVEAYMHSRATLPHCFGPRGVTGETSRSLRWFAPINNAIPDFVACEACYNAHIVGGNFETKFDLYQKVQDPNTTWACDISNPYLNRAIVKCSKSNDWSAFKNIATNRLSKPACQGLNSVKAKTRDWYIADQAVVCEACYLDNAALTMFDHKFRRMTHGSDQEDVDVLCDFAIASLRLSFTAALLRANFDFFRNTVECQANSPLCTTKGITDGQWYTLKGGCENFEICKTCYMGLVCAFGLQSLFETQKGFPPGTTALCDFSPAADHFGKYVARYSIAVNTPNSDVFTSFVKRMSKVPLCRGIEYYTSEWHAVKMADDDTMDVCRSCFEDTMRDRPLEHISTIHTAKRAFCEMYSANMRKRWAALVEASVAEAQRLGHTGASVPPSQAALAEFTAYRNHRLAVYLQTVPEVRRLLSAAKLRLGQQKLLNMNSTFYNNLDRTTAAAQGIHYGPTPVFKQMYGNSVFGYNYETPYGVQGANYAAQAMGLLQAGRGDAATIARLEALWGEVE